MGYTKSNKKFSSGVSDKINANLYILSKHIFFPFKAVFENPEILNQLSPELQEALTKRFLFEIYEPNFIHEVNKFGSLLKYGIDRNLNIKQNLLPSIKIGNVTLNGPVFNIDENGIIETDLVAGEWLDANEYMQALGSNAKYLCNIASCLYRNRSKEYSTYEAQKNAQLFKNANPEELKAVWLILSAIQRFVFNYPPYSVLFIEEKSVSNVNKINIGASELIYQMTKDGFGQLNNIVNMPVIDFLNIQVKTLADAVKSLRAAGKKNNDIANSLKIDVSTVLKL